MIKRCFSCGIEKDTKLKEFYPYQSEVINTEEPINQLFVIDCSPKGHGPYRICVLCHKCFHFLEENDGPDMWMMEVEWESLKPLIPFNKLPIFDHTLENRYNPEIYEGQFDKT